MIDYFDTKKPDLRDLCRSRGLSTGGVKVELIARLQEADLAVKEEELAVKDEEVMRLYEDLDESYCAFAALSLDYKKIERRNTFLQEEWEKHLASEEALRKLQEENEERVGKINDLEAMVHQQTMKLAAFKTPAKAKLSKELVAKCALNEFKKSAEKIAAARQQEATPPASKTPSKKKKKLRPTPSDFSKRRLRRSLSSPETLSQLVRGEIRSEKLFIRQYDELNSCD